MDLAKYNAILQTRELSFEEKLGFILAWEMSDAPDALLAVAVNAHLSQRVEALREAMVKAQTQRLRQAAPLPLGVAEGERKPFTPLPTLTEADYQTQVAHLRQQMATATANILTDPNAAANLELWGNRLASLNKRRPAK